VTSQTAGSLLGFRPPDLARSGNVRPARRIALPGGGAAGAQDVTFDRDGRAYVAQYEAQQIAVLRPPGGAGSTTLRIVRVAGAGPIAVRRSPDGAVWVTDASSADLIRLTAGGARQQRIRPERLNVPHSISFVADRAYVTDMSEWILGYRVTDLRRSGAAPVVTAR
jgi:streptogramin lyase